ncbi:glycosyltransferase family 10 domain-containing protein [Gillisia limnaea]|uniref:Glycosyl transferase n=1 Tax=Gillisia limnaea (strain DSM 15749 / LMG 21470 / R-8282) TaxID=865937 RepID=H2BV74_GILLR|nr:glycosyltransferase family 10 [Gillisia limnaea]EHQ01739.1 glycosyl transferase [Gillisia limnaea DSM 15749]
MIKLFLIRSFVYTPFTQEADLKYLEKNGLGITDKITEADILISQNFKHLKPFIWRYLKTKNYLVWTLEPRFDITFSSNRKILMGLHNCYFMNIYTQDVFTSIFTFHSKNIKNKLSLLNSDFKFKQKKIVALMSYYKGIDSPLLMRDNKNIDLINLRSILALEGNNRGVLDVFGKGWPNNISKEDSRLGNWPKRKEEILRGYSFNLCFENTIAYNYVTEKIWDSIGNYCLPIYYGEGTNIYSVFPENSFLDYSEFDDSDSMFHFVENISKEEYTERMNKCITVYNSISQKNTHFERDEKRKSLDKIIEKCIAIEKK